MWGAETKYASISEGGFTSGFEIPEKCIAHVQVVRQGTAPFNDPMDIHPQTSTDPNRSSKAWDTEPYEPARVPKTGYSRSLVFAGPSNMRIGISNPGVIDTIVADVYVKITGA